MNKGNWPDRKHFAFTVCGDTDRSTLENVREMYSFLNEYGFRTTKCVWPIRGKENPKVIGSTCEDQQYLNWLEDLKKMGFEIGYHMANFESSVREQTIRGAEKFTELFGHDPKSMTNHVGCLENINWGSAMQQRKFRLGSNIRGPVLLSFYSWRD